MKIRIYEEVTIDPKEFDLSKEEVLTLELRICQKMTYREVGNYLGMSAARAYQLFNSGIKKIRSILYSQGKIDKVKKDICDF